MPQFSHLKPFAFSSTPNEEASYRRGYDQGFYACADALGLGGLKIQDTAYKSRIKDWRYGRIAGGQPPEPTLQERAGFRAFALGVLVDGKAP